ncbi:MAG: hypothetical protein IH944_08905 [Armatimonadetes bacterium]|nr:hypothetical protein [Armatimonadota bacterium]
MRFDIVEQWVSRTRRGVCGYLSNICAKAERERIFVGMLSTVTAREILDGLPEDVREACTELFERLPIEQAMPAPVVQSGQEDLYPLVEKALKSAAIKSNPYLVAGIWLYVDDLQKSHVVSQGLDDPTGAYWHAIMHRREGDFWNSKYWLRQTQRHEACASIDRYDAERLVDMADANSPKTVELQRQEWAALFVWCARKAP